MIVPFHHTVQVILLVLGACLLGCAMVHLTGGGQRTARLRLLGVVAMLSVLGYTRFGSFHPYGPGAGHHVYHYPDLYHYYVGAKYFRQVGYFNLYEATLLAFRELRSEGVATPSLANVRDLVGQEQLVPADVVYTARGPAVLARFSPEQWTAFKADLRAMLALPGGAGAWHQMLGDMGFNSPPTWNVTASPLARLIPLGPRTAELLGCIDLLLVMGAAGWFVWRAFGAFGLIAYLMVFGNNWIASFDWTGGSFLRQAWLFWLVAGVCCLKLEWYVLAGCLLGAATADRVWPGFFLLGAGVSLGWAWWRRRASSAPLLRLVASASGVLVLLAVASCWLFPAGYWADFWRKLWQHNQTFFAMHVGFAKLAVFPVALPGPPAWAGDGYVAWERMLAAYYQQHAWLFTAVKVAFIGSALLMAARLPVSVAAVLVGATLLFFTSMPANYYYSYLALCGAVFFREGASTTELLRVLGLFALLVGFALAPLRWPNLLSYNGYINLFVFGYLVLLHGTFGVDLFGERVRQLWRRLRAGEALSS